MIFLPQKQTTKVCIQNTIFFCNRIFKTICEINIWSRNNAWITGMSLSQKVFRYKWLRLAERWVKERKKTKTSLVLGTRDGFVQPGVRSMWTDIQASRQTSETIWKHQNTYLWRNTTWSPGGRRRPPPRPEGAGPSADAGGRARSRCRRWGRSSTRYPGTPPPSGSGLNRSRDGGARYQVNLLCQ